MGKSVHKSRKRKRSPSRHRLEGLEKKLSLLIDALWRKEVTRARGRAPSSPEGSFLAGNIDPELEEERLSDNIVEENNPEQAKSISNEGELTSPARQVRSRDPHVTGVYERPSSVNQTEESTQPFPINRNTLSSFAAAISNLPSEGSLTTSTLVRSIDLTESVATEDSADTLSQELFGSVREETEAQPWNELVTQTWRDLTRNGLPADQRIAFLKKYSPSEELSFLKGPKLNPECKSALKNNAIVKRDEYCGLNQNQLGSALFAFGEAISDLLKPETQRSLNAEAREAVGKINEGVKIVADLFYRLSLSRRALIKSAFNNMAKSTADSIPADNLLFDVSFGEEIKKAASMEKSSRDIINTSLAVSKKIQQPIKFSTQSTSSKAGNIRASVSRSRPLATKRTGAPRNSRRVSHRHRSYSRRR